MSIILPLILIVLVIWLQYTVVSTKKEIHKLQKIVNTHMVELKKCINEKF